MNCPFCENKDEIFKESDLSLAMVNLKPIIPGHSLVVPKRHVKRFDELNQYEVADLFQLAQLTSNFLMKAYDAKGMTMTLQDGKDAGQTVPHLHLHISPRKKGDIKNSDFYQNLFTESSQRAPRTKEEMKKEAEWLKTI